MIGPFWIWGVYRGWRCEKTFFDIFNEPYPTFPERLWFLLTLRWFPQFRLIKTEDWDAYCRSVRAQKVVDPVDMLRVDAGVSGVTPQLQDSDPEVAANLPN